MTLLDLAKSLSIWGPGGAIAVIVIIMLYRLADKFLPAFIAAQQAQAVSLAKLAEGSEGMKACLEAAVSRDNAEHREMIILLKVIKEELTIRREEG